MATKRMLIDSSHAEETRVVVATGTRLDELNRANKLSPAEQRAFDGIVQLAKSGAWDRAERAAFRFAQDQVGVGHPAPKGHSHDHAHAH